MDAITVVLILALAVGGAEVVRRICLHQLREMVRAARARATDPVDAPDAVPVAVGAEAD